MLDRNSVSKIEAYLYKNYKQQLLDLCSMWHGFYQAQLMPSSFELLAVRMLAGWEEGACLDLSCFVAPSEIHPLVRKAWRCVAAHYL